MSGQKGVTKKHKDLDLTMQQKFNFESNSFDEEDTKTYKIKRKQKQISIKREKELINLKNKYKRKYAVSLVMSIIFFTFLLIVSLAYIFVKPKEIKIEKIRNVTDENIVFLGDSITDQYELEKYYNNIHFVNSGISGDKTDDILDDMYNRVYRYNPSKIFLLIGTNDLQYKKSVDDVYNNILEIISKIHKERENSKIYVESIYPINNSNDSRVSKSMVGIRQNSDINEINKKLRRYCKDNGYTYIDVNKELLNDDGLLNLDYSIEGLHLNDEGYKIVTKILKKYI